MGDRVFRTIEEIRAANRSIGHCWFSAGALEFFSSKIYRTLYAWEGGAYFVSSEKDRHYPRLYTVRFAFPDGRVETVGGFQGYDCEDDAAAEASRLAAARFVPE